MQVAFDRGEEMRTEISTKFAREGLEGIYAESGLEMAGWWTDPDGPVRARRWRERPGLAASGASASISSPSGRAS